MDIFNYEKIEDIENLKNEILKKCREMDKIDIYNWIADDEIKILRLHNKLSKKKKILDELKEILLLKKEEKKSALYSELLMNYYEYCIYDEVLIFIEKLENKYCEY